MISSDKLDFAAKQIVDVCLKAKKGEKGFIITDRLNKHLADAVEKKLDEATGGKTKVFVMEDFGDRPDDGVNPLRFPDEIGDAVRTSEVGLYIAIGKKNEIKTFRKPLLTLVNSNKRLRYGHMIGVNDLIMETGMAADYGLVQKMTRKVYDIAVKAKKIRVTTELGTDMTAEFDPALKWICFDSDIKPGHWMNLPEGEVFTCPKDINGRAVIDGVLGDYLGEKFGRIEKTPLYLDLKGGRIVSVKCENKEIEREFSEYIKKEENADRIGEFAIGTNIGLKELIGNLLQDEKFPGVHIAAGHPYPDETGAKWDASSHIDMVIQKVTIDVDGTLIMRDGKFVI